jgi:hypothetical protein
VGSISNEVNELFLIYLMLQAALGPGVYSASNRNEYKKEIRRGVEGGRAENITAICEPIL